MPDIYTIQAELSVQDFTTGVTAEQGYPASWGIIIGWMNTFESLNEVAGWLATTVTDALESLADLIHEDFFPSDAFMADLKFPDKNLFPLPSNAIYVEFDRYAALGRVMVGLIIATIVKFGGAQLLVQLGNTWIQAYLRGKKFEELNDRLDSIDAKEQLNTVGSQHVPVSSEDSIRLANIEKYLHLLGDALRTNKRDYNNELEFRSTGNNKVAVPEWPQV